MTSSKATPSTREILDDHRLTFNCYQFSRNVRSGRPLSRRQVTAKECLCTDDTQKICDPSRTYTIGFYESSDEEEAKHQQDVSEKNSDIPPDRIGAFQLDREINAVISVPPHFLDVLWSAALAADGVLRSISLTVQPQKRGGWAVFEVTLNEAIAEPFDLPLDKRSHPKVGPPRADPVVAELRALRSLSWSRLGPGVIIIAVGVLIALWISKLWLWR